MPDAVQEAARSCLAKFQGREADLAIIFSSTGFAAPSLLKHIRSALKSDVPLIGCSGMNIITPEGLQKEGLVLMLLSSPQVKIHYSSITVSKDNDPYMCAQELGRQLLSAVKGYRREICLLFSDGLSPNASSHIKGLQNILGWSFPFIGGGSSDNLKFRQTYQYCNQEVLSKSIVAAIFTGKLNYGIGVRHGWKPLGKVRTITDSSANVIRKIDGKDAGHLYEYYFGKTLAELRKEIAYINILYPIGIHLPGESEYILRNVIAINDDGSIVTQGDVPAGSTVRLMIGTKESAIEAARQAATQVKAALRQKKIDFAIIVSSVSRACLLGRNADAEIKTIREVLGKDTPLAGFYSYGEYAPLGSTSLYGQTYLHNQSVSILGVSE